MSRSFGFTRLRTNLARTEDAKHGKLQPSLREIDEFSDQNLCSRSHMWGMGFEWVVPCSLTRIH